MESIGKRVKVRVQALIEFDINSNWGTGWTVNDIFSDAARQADKILRDLTTNNEYRYRLISTKYEAVIVPKDGG